MSILLVGWNDRFLLEAAKRMVEAGAPVSHITLVPGYKDLPGPFAGFFAEKKVALLDELAYWRPERIRQLAPGSAEALSAPLVEAMAACENSYLASTDRLSFIPISVMERRRLYYLLLRHWLGFLEDNGISAVVFSSSPHMGWDLLLYHLTKHLGLRTVLFNRTLIKDRVLFYSDLGPAAKVPAGFMEGMDRDRIVAGIGEPLYSDSREESPWSKYSQRIIRSMYQGVKVDWKRVAGMLRRRKEKFLNSSFHYNESETTNGQLLRHYFRYYRVQSSMYRLYHSHTTPPDFGRKYVFFALHFQPERSTLPEGGVFEDQLLALEILAQSLPSDWLIYVKEHPRQFSLRFQSRHGRNEAYYRHMLGLAKVRLIDIQEESAKLAEHAAVVATITGSIGWESLQMGRACIAFGSPWYSPCRSCYLVGSVQECRDAIAAIVSKSKEEVETDVLKLLAFLREEFVLTSNSHEMAVKSKLPYELLAGNLSEKILEKAGEPVAAGIGMHQP